jgi:hypothetical protein
MFTPTHPVMIALILGGDWHFNCILDKDKSLNENGWAALVNDSYGIDPIWKRRSFSVNIFFVLYTACQLRDSHVSKLDPQTI